MYLFSFHLSIFPWQLSLFTTNSAECMGTENISWKNCLVRYKICSAPSALKLRKYFVKKDSMK